MPETKTPTFDRLGYQKTLAETKELEDGMKAVLNLMALYCDNARTVRFADFTQERVREKTSMGEHATARAFARLQRTRLLVKIDSPVPGERAKYWQLPTEEELALYVPSQT